MHKSFWLAAAVSVFALMSPVRAEWRRVQTDHLILTINDSEEGARDFATRLEGFDSAMRRLYGVADDPDQHARPISIYVLDAGLFQQVCGCPQALGYYRPRAEGSFIFSVHMPDIDRKTKTGWWSSQTLLLHEYSHHFAYSSFPIAYPYWYSEGFAEFNANASFEPDGSIIIGYPANYRGEALKSGSRLTPKQLFDPSQYGFGARTDLVYGRGWLLTHYLMLNEERKSRLAAYLTAMNQGKASVAAAEASFGDLKQLNAELDVYAKGKLQAPLRIPPAAAPVDIKVTTLPPGQAAMLPVYALATNGVAEGYRKGVALRAAKIAARYPDDAIVQAQWAEIEYRAERLDNADAASDAALKLDPGLVDAMIRKGQIAILRLRDKPGNPADWASARGWFLKANKANPNAVMPLYLYYLSFVAAKEKPTPGAIKGLMRAEVLAPEAPNIRAALARQLLMDGEPAHARDLLQPIAFAPHRASDKNIPRQLIDLIDAGKIDEAKALIEGAEKDDDRDD